MNRGLKLGCGGFCPAKQLCYRYLGDRNFVRHSVRLSVRPSVRRTRAL